MGYEMALKFGRLDWMDIMDFSSRTEIVPLFLELVDRLPFAV